MARVDTGQPRIEDVGRIHADAELRFSLIADRSATFAYGSFTKTSSDGAPVTGTEPVDGLGNHVIDLSTEGGHVEFTVESPDGKVVDLTSDDDAPADYRWTFVGDPNWTGGHINEEATEIAKMAVAGQPLPSKPPTGDLPGKAVPEMSPEFTRPWNLDPQSGPSAPRKGANPVDDEPAGG